MGGGGDRRGTDAHAGAGIVVLSRDDLPAATRALVDRTVSVPVEAGVQVERAPLPIDGRRRTHGWRNAVDTVRYAIDDLAGDGRFTDARSQEKLAALRAALATLEAESPLLLTLFRIG